MTLGEIVKQYREKNSLTMEEFAKRSGLSKGYISMLERNENPSTKKPIAPSMEKIKQVAQAMSVEFNNVISMLDDEQKVTLNDEVIKTWQPQLTEKEEKDVLKEVENILDGINSNDALMFDGEILDERTKELLRLSLINAVETARISAKKKFTPIKFRK